MDRLVTPDWRMVNRMQAGQWCAASRRAFIRSFQSWPRAGSMKAASSSSRVGWISPPVTFSCMEQTRAGFAVHPDSCRRMAEGLPDTFLQ